MKTINSARKFRISGFENGSGICIDVNLTDILINDNDIEMYYSIQDDTDRLLNLKRDEYFETFANRDNLTAVNRIIIWRIL